MKIRASALLGCAVLLLMTAPLVHAQRGGGGRQGGAPGAGGPAGGGRGPGGPVGGGGGGRPVIPPGTVATPRATTTIPSSPILPITNPVAPIVPTDGTAGTTRRVPNAILRPNSPRRDNVILVGGYGYWPGYYPYYDGWYPQPYLEPAPVPGELPGTYRYQQPTYDPAPAYYAQPDPPSAPMPVVLPEPAFFPEQNIIISPPEPDRVVVPPALGTSKSEVLARYGEPWGSMRAGGKETLYFRGGLTLVFESGKVSEVRSGG